MIYSVISRSRYSFVQPHNTTVFAFLAPKLSGSSDQQKTFWSTSSVWNFTTDVMRLQYKRIFKGGDPAVFVVILIGEKADDQVRTTKLQNFHPGDQCVTEGHLFCICSITFFYQITIFPTWGALTKWRLFHNILPWLYITVGASVSMLTIFLIFNMKWLCLI